MIMKTFEYTAPLCEVEIFDMETVLCSSFNGEHEGFEEFIVGAEV